MSRALSLAGFQVILIGRFWVTTEALQKFLDSFFMPLLVGLALALIGLVIYQKRRRDGKSTRGIWFGILGTVLLSTGTSYLLARRPGEKPDLVIAGRVVDAITNDAISGAKITLSGRTETMFSESNGNFRFRMDEQTLTELRNDLRHMDEPELLAFGRKHRANPESFEYLEAKAEWMCRQQKKSEVPKPQPVGPTLAEFASDGEGGRRPLSVDSVREDGRT
jgi:hypothetical protein